MAPEHPEQQSVRVNAQMDPPKRGRGRPKKVPSQCAPEALVETKSPIKLKSPMKPKSFEDTQFPSKVPPVSKVPQPPHVRLETLHQVALAEWLESLTEIPVDKHVVAFETYGFDDMRFLCERELQEDELDLLGLNGELREAVKNSLRQFNTDHYQPMMQARSLSIRRGS